MTANDPAEASTDADREALDIEHAAVGRRLAELQAEHAELGRQTDQLNAEIGALRQRAAVINADATRVEAELKALVIGDRPSIPMIIWREQML